MNIGSNCNMIEKDLNFTFLLLFVLVPLNELISSANILYEFHSHLTESEKHEITITST